jgi:hypothetical protein
MVQVSAITSQILPLRTILSITKIITKTDNLFGCLDLTPEPSQGSQYSTMMSPCRGAGASRAIIPAGTAPLGLPLTPHHKDPKQLYNEVTMSNLQEERLGITRVSHQYHTSIMQISIE